MSAIARRLAALAGLMLALAAGAQERWTVSGGSARWTVSDGALERLGITVRDRGAETYRGLPAGTLGLRDSEGRFGGYEDGGLLFAGGPVLGLPGGEAVDLSTFRVVPDAGPDRELALADRAGRAWFTLSLGHHWFEESPPTLRAEFIDVHGGPALAETLAAPGVVRLHFGGFALAAPIIEAVAFGKRTKGLCREPRWPNGADRFVDLEMLDVERPALEPDGLVAAGAASGRVFVSPTAEFQIVGTADVPWFFRYVTPDFDGDCRDDGEGRCQPYGESQGGFLVWNLYRTRSDGLLAPLARSGVKHAFNSINLASSDPTRACPCPGRSARVAYAGCEDVYTAWTNADPAFLGPRSELDAFTVSWRSCGSVFDRDCDGTCDVPVDRPPFFPCHADNASAEPYVPAVDLATLAAGDRLHLESWYLVRDDVNRLNSFGSFELRPVQTRSRWEFRKGGDFHLGPVLERVAAEAGRTLEVIDSGRGLVLLDGWSEAREAGWTRFVYSFMNVDFDPALAGFAIPVSAGARLRRIEVLDGDASPGRDWSVERTRERLVFTAPAGAAVDWGTMVTVAFEADQRAGPGGVVVGVAGDFPRANLFGAGPKPVPDAGFVHASGFER